jgi:3-oxoacyl-[acyl-carrier protein] reductase
MGIDLSGKTAIVTGGGQGLGAATAQCLAEAGAAVVITYFEDAGDETSGATGGVNRLRAEETASRIGNRSAACEADVRDPAAVHGVFDEVGKRYGGVDILINNAGIHRDRTIKKMSQDEWQQVIDTNLTGTFNMCREASRAMRDGGRIVNVSSLSGVIGLFGQTNYAASKAGVIGLTRSLSRELARRNILVNAVAPGVVLTQMGLSIPAGVRESMLRNIPMGRFGEPVEIGRVILFLCSNYASYITGQVIHVNGGWIG